jgi:O-antigen ligase
MSRFKQPDRALAPLPPAQLGKTATVYAEEPSRTPAAAAPGFEPAVPPVRAAPPQAESIASKIGMLALCGLMLSPYLQDLTLRLGFKPYLNLVCLVILPVAFLASGDVFRALKDSVGKAWAGFALFSILAIPFSYWPGDSAHVMWNFIGQNLSIFIFTCTFATSYRYCRWIVTTNVLGAALVLINCAVFGGFNDDGRLFLAGSYIFQNSNDLALALLIYMGLFYFLMLRPGILTRALGGVGALGCLYFILKSGSRGGFLALGVFVLVLFLFSRNKLLWGAVALPIVAVTMVLMPNTLLHRLTLILADPDLAQAQSGSDIAAIESQQERQELIKKAVFYSFRYPLTGVGPGQFMNAVWGDEHRQGRHPPALGTHNTYLEVSSECGLPAFFCYAFVVLACIRRNYRVLKRLAGRPHMEDQAKLSYCLLAIIAGFAVNIFFHHLAYTGFLPFLSGLTVCLSSAALAPKPGLSPAKV